MDRKLQDTSVCIPARNEAANIESLLRFVLAELGDGCEVIVGINGCTDNTQRLVEMLAQNDPRVRIVTSMPGKSLAVNALMRASRNDTLLFLDADVSFHRGTLALLVDFLRSTDYVAVCPDTEAIVDSSNGVLAKIRRLWHMPLHFSSEGGLVGRMYALKKKKFFAALKAKGYTEIPPVINEDHFVHLVLESRSDGRKEWSNFPQTVVLFKRSGIRDSYKRAKRIIKGDLQLLHEHKSLGLRPREWKELSPSGKYESSKEKRRRRTQMLREFTFSDRLLVMMLFPVRRIVLWVVGTLAEHQAGKEYRNKEDMAGWMPTKSDREES